MNLRLSLAFTISLFAAAASAQTPKTPPPIKPPAPIGAQPIIKAPVDLGTKRGTAFNSALTKAGLAVLSIPPPPAYARLTPIAPATNGARIVQVGSSVFVGSSAERPDGLLIIDPAPPGTPFIPFPNPIVMAINVAKGTLKIEFSAASNQLYFVDCKASLATSNVSGFTTQSPITFGRSGATTTQAIAPEDGHFIYAFRTGNLGPMGTEAVQLTFPQTSYFFGCEITKS